MAALDVWVEPHDGHDFGSSNCAHSGELTSRIPWPWQPWCASSLKVCRQRVRTSYSMQLVYLGAVGAMYWCKLFRQSGLASLAKRSMHVEEICRVGARIVIGRMLLPH